MSDDEVEMAGTTPSSGRPELGVRAWIRLIAGRVGLYVFVGLVLAFFVLPLAWLATTPFDSDPSRTASFPDFSLDNFKAMFDKEGAMRSLWNSVIFAGGTAVIVVVFASLAAYALSRVRIWGRDGLLYTLLLLSSVVTGTAAMVPIYQLARWLHLIDSRLGVVLVLSGGLLPAAMFILKDFMDTTPRSYEESARVFGASRLQILRHVVFPLVRPGLATVAVWAVAQAWGNFLIPFLLLRSGSAETMQPAAVALKTFEDEGGSADLAAISTFSLLYSIPVVVMFIVVSTRYGFRFHGGIKS